jgi:hypothetical protein
MYEELIKRLRMQAEADKFFSGEPMLYNVAADAIEELQQIVEHYKCCSDDWYKEACDYKSQMLDLEGGKVMAQLIAISIMAMSIATFYIVWRKY